MTDGIPGVGDWLESEGTTPVVCGTGNDATMAAAGLGVLGCGFWIGDAVGGRAEEP